MKSLLLLAVLTANTAGHAASSSTTLSVGAIKPMFDGGTVTAEGSGQGGGSGQTLTFSSGNTSAPLQPGEPVTQTVTLTVDSYENAPPTQSSTLSVTLPNVPGVQFSFKVNGQNLTSAAMSGSVKLEFQVEATDENAPPLSGMIVATITAN
ncbi:hypothetical protein [Deinococcus cellulosilyticus]|uniref:hypothetical protein n=1 Tax=Deinococcus cellulosilyticus TaxID=401558 RepID=UPI0011BDFDAB|nr:hypothetical protein [Deinococcus cellulosilyticus]